MLGSQMPSQQARSSPQSCTQGERRALVSSGGRGCLQTALQSAKPALLFGLCPPRRTVHCRRHWISPRRHRSVLFCTVK